MTAILSAPPLRLAIFDVDGTLADSQHNIVGAMTDAFRAHGLADPDPAAVRAIIGLSLVEAVARVLPEAPPDQVAVVAQSYKQAFVTRRMGPAYTEQLFPGAAEALRDLAARGVVLALATGKSRRGVEVFLERHGLEGLFDAVRTADDGPGKPDPWMLNDILAMLGCEAGSTAMVGDTTYDVEMAVRAGIHAVGVAWGYHAQADLRAAGATLIVHDFGQVAAALDTCWEGATLPAAS
ncbi:haloacid dehalogenase [Rhodospirillum rubrum]|uniref:HAD family hydrolase n=1 Tax=Rhodospirillum rubrum TaxID=1085 RepID=UPI0019040CEB|nr:HAD family hydrolase [Rhodospirillum rubrum]MBK1665129.1 haloacid dehalogenase [Rhodospirillum rubrum]MBK1678315.1 haloacid dehalogenase [Rhodospirillum rubrum]